MNQKAAHITNALAAGALGVLQLGITISLAALIFSGPLASGTGRAVSGFVLGTAIVSLVVGLKTRMTVVAAGAQDTAAVLIAAVAATIVATPEIRTDQMVPTVLVMIAITGVLTGVTFWTLGRFGLTTFVRFLPFPVVSGFTAGTGWLLFRGGIEVMHRAPVELGDLDDLVAWTNIKFLAPGLALALVMVLIVNIDRVPNITASASILAGVLIFHLVGRLVSSGPTLEAQGWLIGPFEEGGWAPVDADDLSATNWPVLLDHGLLIAAAVAVSVIGLLLNLSSLESGPDTDIDMNMEMRAAGTANIAVGVTGGLVGYHLMGDTLLGRQLGARGRVVPLVVAAIAGISFIVGPGLIALVPRAVAGGVLAGLGLTLLVGWLLNAVPRMNRADQAMSSLILIIIAVLGVLTGVGAGVVAAAAVFIIKYSRIDPVRHSVDAAGRSAVDRDQRHKDILDANPEAIVAFELQGYLFFGSTTGLRRQIDARVSASSTDFVVVDFARVTGIDSTAAGGLKAIGRQLGAVGVTTVWSGLRPDVASELGRDGFDLSGAHADLDHAIAWCEDQFIEATIEEAEVQGFGSTEPQLAPFNDALMKLLDLPSVELEEGETLISEGETDTDVYFVESGTLTAWLESDDGEPIRIRRVLPGAALGEISFCTGSPRTATVIADTAAVVRVLCHERFEALALSHPQAAIDVQQELLRRVANRVSSTSAMVRDLMH